MSYQKKGGRGTSRVVFSHYAFSIWLTLQTCVNTIIQGQERQQLLPNKETGIIPRVCALLQGLDELKMDIFSLVLCYKSPLVVPEVPQRSIQHPQRSYLKWNMRHSDCFWIIFAVFSSEIFKRK